MRSILGAQREALERIRFDGERQYSGELRAVINDLGDLKPPDGERVRRQLMSRSLLLSEGMAPGAYAAARHCADVFGINESIEIFQAAGSENAAMHFCKSPALVEIQGRMLALLDEGGLKAIMGHELGHFLAHGPDNPAGSMALAANILSTSEDAPDSLVQLARRYSMSKEFTADRFGLLACGSLDDALRLGMVAVTGLPAHDLNWDTEAYLKQSTVLVEDMIRDGQTAQGISHPEHSLRAWAQWQFSETDVYKELTGLGTGGRPLAELDAQLIEILGHPEIAFDDAQVFEEPQPEVQECALAACALIAHADEELHETEVEAIEKVFAHLLPQWRDFLDREYALERFQELAPMLYSSGPRAQRALFMLLFHVTAADGAIEASEVGSILSIGDALGCPRLFRQLLASILGDEPVGNASTTATATAIPVAAESRQVERALQAFFRRAAQRGGSEVSGRRLLRLTGENRYSAQIRDQLTQSASQEGLAIDPPLSEALDTLHRLEPDQEKAESSDANAPTLELGEASTRLIQTLSKLRDKLVSGDGRSPSVRLRDTRRGRSFDIHQLEHVSVGLAERVAELIRSESATDLIKAEQAQAHEPSARCYRQLIDLQREHLSRIEETGADDLFLGIGFVAASLGGYLLRAPLVLHNVEIDRNQTRIRLKPKSDQSTVANQALLQTMARHAKKTWSDELADAANQAAASGIDAIVAFLDDQGYRVIGQTAELEPLRNRNDEFDSWIDDRIELENCAVLGLFPQSRSDLLHDYDQLLEQIRSGKPVSDILAAGTHLLPSELKSLVHEEPEQSSTTSDQPLLPIIQADPIQREVMQAARDEPALVIDGPPGTGKSQVIVNLICDALLRGEKVAVVCEKRAALDVVVNRLDSEGLRHLLALVHDAKADRKDVYAQVVERVEDCGQAPGPSPDLDGIAEELAVLGSQLKDLRAQLVEEHRGINLGQALVLSSGISGVPEDVPAELSELNMSEAERLAGQFGQLSKYSRFWSPESLWLSPDQQTARPSFATFGARERSEIQQSLNDARDSRHTFEAAFAAAELPLDKVTLKRALALGPQARSLLSAHAQASDSGLSDSLTALFELVSSHGASVIQNYAAKLSAFEERMTTTGLTASRDVLTVLSRTRPQLAEFSEFAGQDRQSLSWMSSLIQDQASLRNELRQCDAAWKKHAEATNAHSQRVTWSDTDEFDTAFNTVKRQLGRWQRFFSLKWWSARSLFKTHVQLNWPGHVDVKASASFLAQVERYRLAAGCWRALDALIERVEGLTLPDESEAARHTVQAGLNALRQTETLEAADSTLGQLQLSPLPRSSTAWAAWRERVNAMVETPPALAELGQARKGITAVASNLPLPQQSEKLQPLLEWTNALDNAISARNEWEALKLWPADGATAERLERLLDQSTKLISVESAFAGLREQAKTAQKHFPWLGMGTPLSRWQAIKSKFSLDFEDLVEADKRLEAAEEIYPKSAELTRLLSVSDSARSSSWEALVTGCWAKSVADAFAPGGSGAERWESAESDDATELVKRYQQTYADSYAAVGAAVIAKQNDSAWFREPTPEKGARRTPLQSIKEAMLKEARKQRRIMPMRSFVRKYSKEGLLDALPVWLLSPETMAQLFPREADFDLVIMDEASQCTVETGLPVLMRAKRIVIAGDEYQMPPSNYFKASVDTEDSDEDSIPLDVMDAESLLVLARDRCHHRRIAWHYRCQYEELIAFSNHAIYDGDLKTIPSTLSNSGPCAISWHAVEGAQYDAGRNEIEAQSVVDLMHRLLVEDPNSTIGVITFNLAQRRTVLDAIDERCISDETFNTAYQAAATHEQLDQRPFVKNLENVQGDERDQIIFSLGHAPKKRRRKDGKGGWYVPARFGPLGQRGGERRLNVAASRAKRAIHLVSSFDPAMLSVANAKHDGPGLFKGFLEFGQLMSAGRRSEASLVLDVLRGRALTQSSQSELISEHFVPLKVQVLLALEDLGLAAELDVGSSSFRVDLAIVDPNHPHSYALGVLFDDGGADVNTFEQHVHVPGVLGLRGWTLMTVSAEDWAYQRKHVIERIQATVMQRPRST